MRRCLQIGLVFSLAAQAAAAGMSYTAVSRTTGGEASSAANWEVHGWIDGDLARIEFASSGNPVMPQGSYLLTQDGGRTLFLVNEAEGTYSRWDLEAMLGMVGGVLGSTGGMVSIEFANLSVEKLSEGSAGSILGYPCVRYTYRTSYDMVMKIMGMKRANNVVTEQEIIATSALDDQGFGVWLRKEPPSLGDEGFDALVRAEMAKIEGFPLKTVTRTTTSGEKKGRTTSETTTMEVTELREESIDADLFVLDPDLVEQPMPMLGAAGVEAEEEEERGGLRGLLKKRRDGN